MEKTMNKLLNLEICGVSPVAVALLGIPTVVVSMAICALACWINPRSLVVVAPLVLFGAIKFIRNC